MPVFHEYAAFVIRIDGRDHKEHVANGLRRMFADDSAMKYSWLGCKHNLHMYNVEVISIVKGNKCSITVYILCLHMHI